MGSLEENFKHSARVSNWCQQVHCICEHTLPQRSQQPTKKKKRGRPQYGSNSCSSLLLGDRDIRPDSYIKTSNNFIQKCLVLKLW